MKKGDIIKFGSYPQNGKDCKSQIEWLVLDVKENEALLISRYGLDCKQYHNVSTDITWEDCDLRKWLNNDFIKSAFSEEEVKRIKFSELKNEDNIGNSYWGAWHARGGNDTKDRIFCLSITEAKQYFKINNDRKCKPTAYARQQGAGVSRFDVDGLFNDIGCCGWLLRSPGHIQNQAAHVSTWGGLGLCCNVGDGYNAVRPALRIIIDEGPERKQWEERERREQEDRIRIQREIQTFGIPLKKEVFIKYGNYPLTADGQKAPIEWLILDFNEKTKEALLISRYGLDCQKYHNVPTDITWEYCDLRKWLNNDFIKLAFSEEEVKKIKVSELKNEDNTVHRTRGGNNTKDRIFCLSFNEAEHYFGSDIDRQCKPTAYARKQGAFVYNDCCYWWLRSPGDEQRFATFVHPRGPLDLHGFYADHFDYIAVRPALRIIIDEGPLTKQLEERERRQREERERKQREEQERRQREEQERRQREEQERKQREEEERRLQEELTQAPQKFLSIVKKGLKKGMIVPFGSYPQNKYGFKAPIEWIVLDVKKTLINRLFYGNKVEVLLISRYGLDCKQYHPSWACTTWEHCDLRKWLNSDFLKSAFSNEESERILVSKLRNDNNPKYYGTTGGNDTKDRIFCLSIAEAEQYFSCDKDRQCRPTAYARKQGAYVSVNNDCCYWWVRSPGNDLSEATYVFQDGALNLYGDGVHCDFIVVRPALRIICNL